MVDNPLHFPSHEYKLDQETAKSFRARVSGEVSKINKVNTIEYIGTKLH
jgi:hypothetical protein